MKGNKKEINDRTAKIIAKLEEYRISTPPASIDLLKFISIIAPKTKPKTIGAGGIESFFNIQPATPKKRHTQASKMEFLIV